MFHEGSAELFVPDGLDGEAALARTTHLGIAAHHDDLEIMAAAGILECFQRTDRWFTGVVVTNGAGSPRAGRYAEVTDEAMRRVRRAEQKKAAVVGEYGAQVLLDHPSRVVKDRKRAAPVEEDLVGLLEATRPEVVYTHNPADKHETHVAVAARALAALRRLAPDRRPRQVLGCEVWRDLDWVLDTDKVALDLGAHENLQAALLGLFDSQVAGGKRYDLATLGRRRAHATYFASHAVDETAALTFALDLTPLLTDPTKDLAALVQSHIDRFARDVQERIRRVG